MAISTSLASLRSVELIALRPTGGAGSASAALSRLPSMEAAFGGIGGQQHGGVA